MSTRSVCDDSQLESFVAAIVVVWSVATILSSDPQWTFALDVNIHHLDREVLTNIDILYCRCWVEIPTIWISSYSVADPERIIRYDLHRLTVCAKGSIISVLLCIVINVEHLDHLPSIICSIWYVRYDMFDMICSIWYVRYDMFDMICSIWYEDDIHIMDSGAIFHWLSDTSLSSQRISYL